jgi:hypothetical protein
MSLIVALVLAVLVVVVLLAPQRWALLGMLAGALYLTQSQAVTVFGLNLFAIRLLEVAGFVRVMARGEFSFAHLNRIDQALLLLYTFTPVVCWLRSADGIAYVVGVSTDAFLCYFTFRGLVGDMDNFRWFLRSFLLLLAPYAALVMVEALTHRSVFSFMGEGNYAWTREGRFRCVGSFRNADLLGTLGAGFLPLYIGLAFIGRERRLACLGMALCLLLVWASNSGGPLAATAVGLVGWGLWRVRTQMRIVRRSMAAMIVLLALLMQAPVWYLLARISGVTGGSGWHRSYLIDVALKHLGQWWLSGMPIMDTADWFPYTVNSGADITNQYIGFGLTAGLGAIALLCLVLKRSFSSLGKALEGARSGSQVGGGNEFLLWGLGVMLAVHVANWFGITYFDQTYMIWFMQLATISNLSAGPKVTVFAGEGNHGMVAAVASDE